MITQISREILSDNETRLLLSHPFDGLSNNQSSLLKHYSSDESIKHFIWMSNFCAHEFMLEDAFTTSSLFVNNIEILWQRYNDLPEEVRIAFAKFGEAIENMTIHVHIFASTATYVDEVITPFVKTRNPQYSFIRATLDLFEMIDACYHPGARNAMNEEERTFILGRVCDSYRPLLKEKFAHLRAGTEQPLRDQIAIEVVSMVRDWGDDECFDHLENYPIGPEIDTKRIKEEINNVANSGLFNVDEIKAYKQLKMRDMAELIKIYANFGEYDEANSLYAYFGQLVRELGGEINASYHNRYHDAGNALKEVRNP